jgi:hypothetical protein
MILDYFGDESNITANILVYSKIKDASGRIVESYAQNGTVTGFRHTKQDGTVFTDDKFKPIYKDELICEPPVSVTEKDRLEIDSVEYAVDYIDNVGSQDEVLLIGLRKI